MFIDTSTHPKPREDDIFDAQMPSSLKEYETQACFTMQAHLLEREKKGHDIFQPWSVTVFGCVLLADISGFTKLANKLDIESLKFHINNFFTILLSCVRRCKGDVVKFCGDAVLVMWTVPKDSPPNVCAEQTRIATNCGLQLMSVSSQYNHGSEDSAVSLRLHCGLSAGELHLMCLGDSVRMEFLISGSQLKEMGSAAKEAQTGDLCLSPAAFKYVEDLYEATQLPNGNYKINLGGESSKDTLIVCLYGSRVPPGGREFEPSVDDNSELDETSSLNGDTGILSFLSPVIRTFTGASPRSSRSNSHSGGTPHSSSSRMTLSDRCIDLTEDIFHSVSDSRTSSARHFGEQDESLDSLLLRSPRSLHSGELSFSLDELLERMLLLFVHQSARVSIVHNSIEYLSQLRQVVTMFIEILNLDEEFNSGQFERPQIAIEIILQQIADVNGALRQYVVDDKGCVVICNFGVPGFSCINDSIKAIYAAHEIIDSLKQENITCRIGIARGTAFCGYVGSKHRKEYSIMGSSVNLAARLMGNSKEGQVLVSSEVYFAAHGDFVFEELASVVAKGYAEPVHVFLVKKSDTFTKEHVMFCALHVRQLQVVGFERELKLLHNLFEYAMALPCQILELPVCPSSSISPSSSKLSFGSEVAIEALHEQASVVVVGEAGGGKSVLVQEFIAAHFHVLKTVPVIVCQKKEATMPYTTIYKILRRLFHVEMIASSAETIHHYLKKQKHKMRTSERDCFFQRLTEVDPHEAGAMLQDCKDHENDFFDKRVFQSDEKEQLYDEIVTFVRANIFELTFLFQQSLPHLSQSQVEPLLPFLRIFLCCPNMPSMEDCFPNSDPDEVMEALQHLIVEVIQYFVLHSPSKSLIVEDLHCCDANSYFLIEKLLLDFSNCFFLGTMTINPNETEKILYRQAAFSVDHIKDICTVIHVPKLNRNAVRHIVEYTLGPHVIEKVPWAVSEQSISKILMHSTQGTPKKVIEQAQYLQVDIAHRYFGSTGSPTTKEEVYLDSMSERYRVIVRTASVCGPEFNKELLSFVFKFTSYDAIVPLLDESLAKLVESDIIYVLHGVGHSVMYCFTNPQACVSINRLMLENQRQAIHTATVKYHFATTDVNKLSSDSLETLTQHISLSNNIPLEIEFTLKLAELLDSQNDRSKAYVYYSCLIQLVCLGRSELDFLVEVCSPSETKHVKSPDKPTSSHHRPTEDFETDNVNERYLCHQSFGMNKFVLDSKMLVSRPILSLYIAKMSILKYNESKFKESNNLFLLALHMRGINLFRPLFLVKFILKKTATRQVFADLFVQQSDLSLQLGNVSFSRTCALAAIELVPRNKGTAFIQATTLLCSINIFLNNMRASDHLYAIIQEYESHDMEQSFTFRHFHLAVKALSFGDIEAARLLLMKAATKGFVHKEFTPLRFALENLSRWLNLITGEKELKFSDISIEDSELRDIWMLQGNAFQDTFKGDVSEATKSMHLLKERQKNQSGSLYCSALLGYYGVRFQHYSGESNSKRDACVNAVILSGRKLCERRQTTPIGILCLFLSAYCALTILLPPLERADVAGPNAPPSRVKDRGDIKRLQNVAKSCLKGITALSKQFPFLMLFKETLTMLQSCVFMMPMKHLHATECRVRKDSPIALFHEFILGCDFWYEARERYCATFGAEGDLKEEMFEYIDRKRAGYRNILGCIS